MAKLTTLSLEELYSRKTTKAVEDAIIPKENFDTISPQWCDKVCTLKQKAPSSFYLLKVNPEKPLDVLIIQDYKALDDPKFKRPGYAIEKINLGVIEYLAKAAFTDSGITYKVTSLLKCSLDAADLVKGKAPSEVTMRKCRPYLFSEIDRLKPKVIVSLTTGVTKALGLKKSNKNNLGDIFTYKDIPVVLTLHPRILMMLRQNSTGAFWGPDFYSVILRDLNKVRRIIQGELGVPDLDSALARAGENIWIPRTEVEAQEAIAHVLALGRNNVLLSYDTETTGLDPMDSEAKLLTAQFGYKENGIYKAVVFPLWHRENTWYDPDLIWPGVAEILTDPAIGKVGHNMKFDYLYTWHTTGVKIRNIVFDTMLILHMINSGLQGMYGLKQAVVDWIPETELGGYEDKLPDLTKAKDLEEEGEEEEDSLLSPSKPVYRTYEDFPVEDLLLYAGIDCLATSQLAASFGTRLYTTPKYTEFYGPESKKREVLAPSIMETYEKYTGPAFDFITDLEINGIKYDKALNRDMDRRMRADMDSLEREIKLVTGDVNLDSGTELAKFLYEVKGFTPQKFTKMGDPSTDGDAIRALYSLTQEEWLRQLAKRNDIASTWRTFIKDYLNFVKRDGRIHPSYNLHGTSSFRISGEDPNLTQIPRAKHGYNIRECYCVEQGNAFVTFDFSSAEVKVLGALSKDPLLLEAIRKGMDFHSFSAGQMFGIPYEEFVVVLKDDRNPLYSDYKNKRQVAKALTFGIIYGSTANGIAHNLDIPLSEAERLIALYFVTYPGIEVFISNAHKMAEFNHFVVTVFGFRKMQFGTLPPFRRTAVYKGGLRNSQNVLIQSPTSSAGLFAFGRASEAVKSLGGMATSTVYDSLELEVPIPRVAEAIELIFQCMDDLLVETFDWLDLPIGSDAEIGFNWGKLKSVHRGVTQPEIEAVLFDLKG